MPCSCDHMGMWDRRENVIIALVIKWLGLGLHTEEEMESPGFARYWSESERMIPGKGDLRDYWRDISTNGDFLGLPPSLL
ncbi:hypothetical protein Tco_1104102 [Tanacetum coccineum]